MLFIDLGMTDFFGNRPLWRDIRHHGESWKVKRTKDTPGGLTLLRSPCSTQLLPPRPR
jgi:hypothetical protein